MRRNHSFTFLTTPDSCSFSDHPPHPRQPWGCGERGVDVGRALHWHFINAEMLKWCIPLAPPPPLPVKKADRHRGLRFYSCYLGSFRSSNRYVDTPWACYSSPFAGFSPRTHVQHSKLISAPYKLESLPGVGRSSACSQFSLSITVLLTLVL